MSKFKSTFERWLRLNAASIPLRLEMQRSGGRPVYRFPELTQLLQGRVPDSNIAVDAFVRGYVWDVVIDLDCLPQRHGLGWQCRFELEQKRSFESRHALWVDHQFEPLREWIVQKLVPATHLSLLWSRGVQVASLVTPGDCRRSAPLPEGYREVLVALRRVAGNRARGKPILRSPKPFGMT